MLCSGSALFTSCPASRDRLWLLDDPDQDNAITEDEWIYDFYPELLTQSEMHFLSAKIGKFILRRPSAQTLQKWISTNTYIFRFK